MRHFVSQKKQRITENTQGESIMTVLFFSGAFFVGIMLLEKLNKSSHSWKVEQERKEFQRQREKWRNEVLYWTFFR
jgi:hypothetical protein